MTDTGITPNAPSPAPHAGGGTITVAGTRAASPLPIPPNVSPEKTLSPAQWGMAAFLLSEVALFGTLLVTYVHYLGLDLNGPTPAQALKLPLVIIMTICLLCSSVTIHLAEKALARGATAGFFVLWAATIVLGVLFLLGTAYEWHDLIYRERLTISTNLFGSTYYTVVGLHACHVTGGVIIMLIVLGLAVRRQITSHNQTGVELTSWYWHFVDVVWVAVFSIVYLFGR